MIFSKVLLLSVDSISSYSMYCASVSYISVNISELFNVWYCAASSSAMQIKFKKRWA